MAKSPLSWGYHRRRHSNRTPEDPVIENHAGRMVIGYNMKLVDGNGRLVASLGQILAPSVEPVSPMVDRSMQWVTRM